MKLLITLFLSAGFCLSLAGCTGGNGPWQVILILLAIAILAFAGLRTYQFIQYCQRLRQKKTRRKIPSSPDTFTLLLYGLGVLLLLVSILLGACADETLAPPEETSSLSTEDTAVDIPGVPFLPTGSTAADSSNWGISWEVLKNGNVISNNTVPLRTERISFSDGIDYFALPGIASFRGNNYRNSATYGTANIQEKTLSSIWTSQTSTLAASGWDGSGWTGQPLMVQWDAATKSIMNLYPAKQAKQDLVEVIYATLDGHIYFLDLEDGSYTRDPIDMGMCFKGAGSLDPRGYPLMYVGAGDVNGYGKPPRFYIISLIDGSVLFEYGNGDPLALRKDNDSWCAFDSAPLVDAETDTLIWPGENGILYTFKLNTVYDSVGGTVSVSPDSPISARYTTNRSSDSAYWLGYEASASVVDGYLYVSENGGMFYCVDLNTMELIWAQDTKDDSNSSPVFQSDGNGGGYLYTAPSLRWTQDENHQGTISLYKLDALTGEILWEVPFDVHTVDGVSGGVQSTALLGKPGSNIDGMIFYTVARTPNRDSGVLIALDTETGEECWRVAMPHYAWSSPVAFYSETGEAYIVICDSAGNATLLDGKTGGQLHSIDLGFLVEASPAIFEDTLVVGTRGKLIHGIKIK